MSQKEVEDYLGLYWTSISRVMNDKSKSKELALLVTMEDIMME